MKRFLSILLLAGSLAIVSTAVTGCSTTAESENNSAIPWNSPKGWEHGLPSGMNPGQPY